MNENISVLIKAVSNSFERTINNDFAEMKLTASQSYVLCFIFSCGNREINPRDIEMRCHLKKPTVSGILKRLYEKRLIEILPSDRDNRFKQIRLTERFMEHKELVDKKISEVEEILLTGISQEEKEQTRLILSKMLDNLNNIKR